MAALDGLLDWHLHHVRDAITSDWDLLASGTLTAEQRKLFREHLNMNLAALRELKKNACLAHEGNESTANESRPEIIISAD